MSESSDKTSMGIEPKLAGLLCYLVGWVTGIVFLIMEKDNKFVRFHAVQSIITFGVLNIAGFIFGFIPILGLVVNWLIGVLALILWIVLMMKAYQGQMYKLPVIGDIAEKNSKPMAK